VDALDKAIDHAKRSGDSDLELDVVLESVGPIAFGPVNVDDGYRWIEDVLGRHAKDPSVHLFTKHALGHLRARRGEFDSAQRDIREWRSQFRELGQEAKYANSAVCVWDVWSLAEDWSDALSALEEAYTLLEGMGEKAGRSTLAAFLGVAHYRLGRVDEAERYSEISKELGSSDDRVTQAGWRALRAKVLASRGLKDEAIELANEAAEIISESDNLDFRAGVLLDRAEVLRTAAREEEARTAVENALALYEQKGNLVGAERARALLAT
jgi:tetratricopeptide (TPR) repeat protein